MGQVAEHAGVSVKTVSNVVNDYIHVSDAMRERVQESIDALGYKMNLPARSLRKGVTGAIGLAIPDLVNPYFAAIGQGVMREASKHDLQVFIEVTDGDPRKEIEVLSDPLRSMTDGLIVTTTGWRRGEYEAELQNVTYPLVVLGEQTLDPNIAQVSHANEDGAYAATQFLIDRGANRIALLGAHRHGTATSALRESGYLAALAANNIPVDRDLILQTDDWRRRDGQTSVQEALDRGVKFDGLFAMNDALAIGALHALHSNGLHVPGDVQVIGWDNLAEGRYSAPPLTGIDPRIDLIATKAVDLLVASMQGGSGPEKNRLTMPYEIVERGSTKPL